MLALRPDQALQPFSGRRVNDDAPEQVCDREKEDGCDDYQDADHRRQDSQRERYAKRDDDGSQESYDGNAHVRQLQACGGAADSAGGDGGERPRDDEPEEHGCDDSQDAAHRRQDSQRERYAKRDDDGSQESYDGNAHVRQLQACGGAADSAGGDGGERQRDDEPEEHGQHSHPRIKQRPARRQQRRRITHRLAQLLFVARDHDGRALRVAPRRALAVMIRAADDDHIAANKGAFALYDGAANGRHVTLYAARDDDTPAESHRAVLDPPAYLDRLAQAEDIAARLPVNDERRNAVPRNSRRPLRQHDQHGPVRLRARGHQHQQKQ